LKIKFTIQFLIIFLFIYTPILSLFGSETYLLNEDTVIEKKNNDDFIYWYYKPDKFGARAFHNPLQFIIEGGMPGDKALHNVELGKGLVEVFKKVLNPVPLINDYGWKKFIYYEFIPHFGKGNNWVPNYTWHLLGGGFRTRMMIEYYHYHNYSHPAVWGWTTMYIMHFLNEATQVADFIKLENEGGGGDGNSGNDKIDAIPDLMFFDWIGGVIFSYDPVNRFMTRNLHLSEWTYQSQLNIATNRLLNNGQIYWMRYQLFDTPFSLNWISGAKINAPGFSYEYKKDHYLSFGFGLSVNKIAMDDNGDLISGSTVYTMGFYYSIADNPLLTVTLSMPDYKAMKLHLDNRNEYNMKFYVNLYPSGLITFLDMDLGLTFAYDRDTFFIGITNGSWPIGFTLANQKPPYYNK